MLAKPVRRWSFVAGKVLGIALLMFVFVGLLTTLLGAYLWWREQQLITIYHEAFLRHEWATDYPDAQRVQLGGLAINALLQWLKFDVLAAITMLVASFSNTNLYTVIVSFFIFLICQLQYIAQDHWEKISSPALRGIAWLLSKCFPNFQLFAVGELLVFPAKIPVPHTAVAAAIGYGLLYLVVFTALAVGSFRSREI
jgi:ABC-type Na+ efflux pump permease subunit